MRVLKLYALRLGLVLGSIGATYLVLEFVVFTPNLHYLPLKFHGDLPRGVRLLAQSSKRALIPKDYVAIAGDSYAQGYGEWFLEADVDKNPPYHSGHILHSTLNVDVITFGAGGAGSLRGLVSEPIAQWEYVNSSPYYSLEQPDEVLVYFYAGNDLNDNLKDLALRFPRRASVGAIPDADEFRKFIADVVLRGSSTYVEARGRAWYQNLLFAQTMRAALARSMASPPTPRAAAGRRAPKPPPINWAQVGPKRVPLPAELQSPALELTTDELRLGTYVFEQAVLYLKAFFSRSHVRIVYVPSVLECYEIVSAEVDIQSLESRGRRFPSTFLAHRSLAVRELVQSVAREHGLVFVDATPFVRKASQEGFVHGPKEWRHFNRRGYEALAQAAIRALSLESPAARDRDRSTSSGR